MIVLNIVLLYSLSVNDFNLKFKKQSEKLKHYEGEHYKNQELETDVRRDTIGVEMKTFRAVGRKSKPCKNAPSRWEFHINNLMQAFTRNNTQLEQNSYVTFRVLHKIPGTKCFTKIQNW